MENEKLKISDFNYSIAEREIWHGYGWKTGLPIAISIIVDLSNNKISYEVGTTEKTWSRQDLQSAIDTYNEL